jgi:protein-disulfide isomerase
VSSLRPALRLAAAAATGAGLAASALLLWAYETGAEVCRAGGCDEVRRSALAEVAGIPTPVFGIAFFAVAAGLLLAGPRDRRWLIAWSAAGAAVGATLLAVQIVAIGALCPLCVVADLAAIALLAVAPAAAASAGRGPRLPGIAIAAIAAAAVFALTPTDPGDGAGGDLPAAIAAEQRPGVATIVEFIDFECPGCRRLHQILSEVVADYGDRVRVVRKNVPLPNHRHAEIAARAYCCAETAGRGEDMADVLFTSRDLSRDGCLASAERLGLERGPFERCLDSEAVTERLERDLELAARAEVRALPTFYVGEERLVGAQPPDVIRASIERALAP